MDTWFGTKKKERGRGGGSQLPRPHSESDFNEVEEQESFVEQLGADEKFLNEKFEEMLVSNFLFPINLGLISHAFWMDCDVFCGYDSNQSQKELTLWSNKMYIKQLN